MLGFGSEDVGRIHERFEIAFGGKLAGDGGRLFVVGAGEFVFGAVVGALDEGGMDVDQVFDAEAGVDEIFDLFDAEAVHVAADAIAVVGHLVHHFAIGLAEPIVVLEEIAMAVDMGHDQFLVGGVVGAHQVGVAGIVVDHQLVDFLQAVGVAFGELFVLHAEAPVGIARGEAPVGGDFVELIVVDDFEDGGVEIEAVAVRMLLHLALDVGQVGGERGEVGGGGHASRVRVQASGIGRRRKSEMNG